MYLVSTLDQPSGHFPDRAHQMYFGHLMRLARPQHFLKYRNHYIFYTKMFSKIYAKWTYRNNMYHCITYRYRCPSFRNIAD